MQGLEGLSKSLWEPDVPVPYRCAPPRHSSQAPAIPHPTAPAWMTWVALTIHQLWKLRANQWNSCLWLCPVQKAPHVPLGGRKYLKHFSLKKPSCQDHSHILSRLSSVSFNVMWGQQFYTELVPRFIKDRWRPNPNTPRTHRKLVPASLDASVTLARLRRLWVWNRARTMSKRSPL